MRAMILGLLCSLTLVGCAASTPSTKQGDTGKVLSDEQGQMVDGFAKQMVDEGWTPGLVVGVVTPAGTKVLTYGNAGADAPVAPDTEFEIGSISKVFTSIILAKMVGEGTVALDDPVQKYLPDGVTVPSKDGKQITLVELATHTSGLPRLPTNLAPADPHNPYADYTAEKLYAYLNSAQLVSTPGEKVAYSNLGVGLLGHALARAAGKSYEALLADVVTGPLGLTQTSVQLSQAQQQRFAQGYDADGNPAEAWNFDVLVGAGGIRSTGSDMVDFLRANMHQKGELADAIGLTQKPRVQAHGEVEGHMGLGWIIRPDGVVWHNGGTGGFHSFIGFSPQDDVGVVVLANAETPAVDKLGPAVLDVLRGKPAALDLPHVVDVAPAVLKTYVGTYAFSPQFKVAVTYENGRLFVQATNQPKFGIYPESPTKFFLRAVDAEVDFEKDDSGKVVALVLHQAGHTSRGVRE